MYVWLSLALSMQYQLRWLILEVVLFTREAIKVTAHSYQGARL